MKKLLFICKTIVLLIITITAAGQYTGSNPNIAAFKLATATDSVVGNGPSKAVDTLLSTYCAIPGAAPVWFQIDLGKPYRIDGFGMILSNPAELPGDITFQASPDGLSWFDLEDVTITGTGTFTFDLTYPDVYSFVKFYITSKDALASFTELHVYGVEESPPVTPLALAATSVTSDGFIANWDGSGNVTGYSIEVATDIDFTSYVTGYADKDVGNVLSTDVTGLLPVSTYYYRVKAYNKGGSSMGSNKISVTTLKQAQTIDFGSIDPVVYGAADFDLNAAASSGLAVSYASSDESVATVTGSTVTITGVGTATITASQEGDAQYEAAAPVDQDLEVTTKELTVTGAVAEDKVYDGTTLAVVFGGILSGITGDDEVTLVDTISGEFVTAEAGTDIEVTTAFTISGADSANYILVQPSGITADITPKALTVTGIAVTEKTYDGTTDATLSGGTPQGVIGDDVVTLEDATSGTFAQTGAGTGIDVSTAITLGGADAGNYTLEQPADVTGNITPAELLVTANDMSREECTANPDFTMSYGGFVGSDDESVLTTMPEASTTADKNNGTGSYDITVSGGSADNYTLSYVMGTLTITPDLTDPVLTTREVTVQLDESGNASITPDDVVESVEDNCGVVDTLLSQSTFTSGDVGEVLVEVTVTDAAGNEDTEFAVVTVEGSTGVFESGNLHVTLYPNPTPDRVEMSLSAPADGLKVMDMTGKTVIKRSDLRMSETIDLTGFSTGIYLFQLQMGESLYHFKVVKK